MVAAHRSPDPVAGRLAGESRRGRRQGVGVARIQFRREPDEHPRAVADQLGLTHQNRHQVAPCDLLEQGHNLVTDPVAKVPRVAVRLVVDGPETERPAQLDGFGPAQRQDRPPVARGHAAEPVPSAAADQRQKDGLGLVVGRVAEQGAFGQDRIAGLPGSGLEVGAVLHPNRH